MSRFFVIRLINLLVLGIALLGFTVARAGNEMSMGGATVSANVLTAFAEASSSSRPVRILKQGEVVNIILRVTTSGDDWCRVVFQGQNGLTGYVSCKGLGPVLPASSHKVSEAQQSGSGSSTPNGQSQSTEKQGADMTNARVIGMSKLGLDDDIIIAKIKNANCSFHLEDADLVDLKKAGVTPKVIAAMVDSSALTSPRVTIDKNESRTPATSPLQTRQKVSCYYSGDKAALKLVIDRNSDTQSKLAKRKLSIF